MAPCLLPLSQKSGRDNFGVVEHQTVPRLQKLQNIPEPMMGHLSPGSVQDQEPGGRTILQGILGNQLLGQVKEKV
jgi:hypothetical protein